MVYIFGLAAMSLAWLLPGHYYPWTAFQQDALASVGACLVGLGAVVSVREWPARVPWLAALSLLLATVPLLQWIAGMLPFLSDAVLPSAYLIAFALMIIGGFQLTRGSRRFVGALYATLFVAGIVSVGLCLAQWFRWGPYGFLEQLGPDDRLSANLVQPNQLASLLGLGIASVWGAFESRRITGWIAAVGVACLGFGMVMTQSRAAWLFVVVFVLMWTIYRRRVPLRTPFLAVAVSVGLFVAGVLAWGILNSWVGTGFAAESLAARSQSGHRWVHWQTVADALSRSPWLGYGWMQISVAQQAAVLDHPAPFEWLSSSHNQFLDLMVWNGVPLGLLVIGVIVWWSVTTMRRCRDADTFALVAGLGVLFAHSMVEFPLQYAYFLLPAGLMIGAVEARMSAPPALSTLNVGRAVYAFAAVGMAAVLYMVADEYFQIEDAVRRARLRDAGYVQQGSAEPAVPDAQLLDGPREYLRVWMSESHENMTVAELDRLRTVTQRYSSPPALMRYALAAGLNGRQPEARRTLEIMCHVSLEKHCDQGRVRWRELTMRHPQLRAIPFPNTPQRR